MAVFLLFKHWLLLFKTLLSVPVMCLGPVNEAKRGHSVQTLMNVLIDESETSIYQISILMKPDHAGDRMRN